ncbi:MAG: hypothetical protein ACJAQ6_000056 [Arenicella sp.]|jgi:hypothetical protein
MKNLSICLALILTLSATQSVLAESKETATGATQRIEKIVAVTQPEVANFEIFSLKNSQQAINHAMHIVADSLVGEQTISVQSSAESLASI